MARQNLKRSMFILDLIVLLAIFFSVYILFELVIKKILINYSVNKFYESMRTTQFDIANSITYIEEKRELNYEKHTKEVLNYLKISTLKRSRYDNSIMAITFPSEDMNEEITEKDIGKEKKETKEADVLEGEEEAASESDAFVIAGKRNEPDFEFNPKYFKYDKFKKEIERQEAEENTLTKRNYVTFNVKGRQYIGIAKFSDMGLRKDFIRKNNELIYPIFIIAERSDEFFFLINRVRNVFIILLLVVFAVGAGFKIYNTIVISREIKGIGDRMSQVSKQINQSGVISGKLKETLTKFIETYNLDHSFLGMVKSLEKLGEIISGIADRDLLIATLKNDNSVLNPHDEMMAVIFLDIQGFTTISEKHKDDIMNIVNHIWLNTEGVIGKRHGKINKYEGDACLIIFRDADNKSNIHTALNAFYAGIQLLEMVPRVCKELDIEFNFRVGIDYGKVIYGKTGTDNNFELGVIGDPVNTAARLEALNKQYGTNLMITDSAFSHTGLNVKDVLSPKDQLQSDVKIKCLKLDKARPKGKKEAKELFTVLKVKDTGLAFIGSEKYFKPVLFSSYMKLLEAFHNCIVPWQQYDKYYTEKSLKADDQNSTALRKRAELHWSNIAREFTKFNMASHFPPANHFIKALLKFEELDEFKKGPDDWLKKKTYRVKTPSPDWIKNGTLELAK